MRRLIDENTTVHEVMKRITRLEQTAGTFYLKGAKIRVKLSPKIQK